MRRSLRSSLPRLGPGMRKERFPSYAPRSGLLKQNKEIGIPGPTPVSRLKLGHSGIPGVLYSDDPSFEIGSRSALLDDRAKNPRLTIRRVCRCKCQLSARSAQRRVGSAYYLRFVLHQCIVGVSPQLPPAWRSFRLPVPGSRARPFLTSRSVGGSALAFS